jgi:alkylation response protein AidB-like acyl-CoA dehydrogenase
LSAEQARTLEAEIARLELPPPLVGFGLTMIGPTLLQFGSEELKREHLPKITRGQIRWCQGYSEPNAGSDLASLQTAAAVDGDHYVINGQKVWTSYGDLSDWMFMLVRTDPGARKKQTGITFLLIDMATPGVTARPIRLISGASPFCETFFSDARVPRSNVVGEVNGGWTVAKALLGHERAMIANFMGSGGRRDRAGGRWWDPPAENRLADLLREYAAGDPILRDRTAQLSMDELCFQLTVQRAADGARAASRPRDLALQALRNRTNPAAAGAGPVHPRAAGSRLGRGRLLHRGAPADPRLAAIPRQQHRGRHLRDPAERHRQTSLEPPGLTRCTRPDPSPLL